MSDKNDKPLSGEGGEQLQMRRASMAAAGAGCPICDNLPPCQHSETAVAAQGQKDAPGLIKPHDYHPQYVEAVMRMALLEESLKEEIGWKTDGPCQLGVIEYCHCKICIRKRSESLLNVRVGGSTARSVEHCPTCGASMSYILECDNGHEFQGPDVPRIVTGTVGAKIVDASAALPGSLPSPETKKKE